jgi:hypothetical protein
MRSLQHTIPAVVPTASCDSSDPLRRLRWLLFLIQPPERLADRLRPRVNITHRGLDGVMSGDVLRRKGVRVLSRFGQNRVAQSVKSRIRIDHNLITGKLFPETPHFRFEYPGLDFWSGCLGWLNTWRRCHQVKEVIRESWWLGLGRLHLKRAALKLSVSRSH